MTQPPRWVADAVFYEIFPDRFARSARLNRQNLNFEPWDSAPTIHGFKGGDLLGIAEHLDYLQELGITALYLTPVFASASNHRYHTYDYYNVDPLLGGNSALRELIDQCHGRGLRLILDGVFNHASRGFWQFHHVLENGAASPYLDWFHFDPERLAGRRHWGAYPSAEEQEATRREGSFKAIGYQAWWDLPALPKFNTTSPAVREFLFGVAQHWIEFGADGWRLDVPGEIDDDSFWKEFRRRVRDVNPDAYLVGELWGPAQRWLQGDQFDASMNYPLAAACLSFFPGSHLDLQETLKAGGHVGQVSPIDAGSFADRVEAQMNLYGEPVTNSQLNLLDSHDTPRFLTCATNDVASLELALTFLFAYPGAPCLFYGDEIGLTGRQDPECRCAFPWDATRRNQGLHDLTSRLAAVRRDRAALRHGNYRRLYASDRFYAFERSLPNDVLVVALNAGDQPASLDLDTESKATAGFDVLAGRVEADHGDPLHLTIAPRAGAILGSRRLP